MIVVMPSYSEIGPVDQLLVPDATPAPPVELVHVICVMPRLSCAMPLTMIEPVDVDTKVAAGDKIVSEGGAELPPGLGLPGGLGADGLGLDGLGFGLPEIGVSVSGGWLVTVTLAETVSPIAS